MKKLVLAGLFVVGSSVSLMADYVVGYTYCKHPNSSSKNTYFVVKGQGNNLGSTGRGLAMADFLNAEYASETNDYCKHQKVWSKGTVFSYSSKSKANRKFADLLNTYKRASYVKKLVVIKKGYDESDWR